MHVTIINGSSGVGKTTVLHHILHRLPARSAILDGDDLARLHPFQISTTWLNLVQDNLLACAVNMRAAGVERLLCAFVFPGQERVDRLNRIFDQQGFTLCWIHLVAGERATRQRLGCRGVQRADILDSAVRYNDDIAHLARTNEHRLIDTTDLPVEVVCDLILDLLAEPT